MKSKLRLLPVTLALLALYFAPSVAHAAPGELDTTFAGTGKLVTGFGGGFAVAYAAAVQNDGKLILAGYGNGRNTEPAHYANGGDFLIARFDTNNVLDASFGDGGKVLTQVTTNYPRTDSSAIKAVKVQADGKIVAGGYAFWKTNYADFTLTRYNADGSLDTTFGTNGTGIVHMDFGQFSEIKGMTIQSDGNILVAGFLGNETYPAGIALARYDTNGVPDPSFGTGGKAIAFIGGIGANALLAADGYIFTVGSSGSSTANSAFSLARFTTNGVLDTTFGGAGLVITQVAPATINEAETANALALQLGGIIAGNPDKLVVAGTTQTYSSGAHIYQTVLRYNLDGALDTTFGNNGIVTNAIIASATAWQYCNGLVVQSLFRQPIKITIGGYGYDGTNWVYSLARFTEAGALDTSFGANSSGKNLFPIPRGANGAEGEAAALVVQSGNYVLAGAWDLSFGESDFAAVRFTSSGAIDTGFGSNGLLRADVSDAPGGQADAVALQPDGKIVAAGATPPVYLTGQNLHEQSFALARFNADGSLDGSFGSAGKVMTAIGSNDLAYAVAVQPDGKIVAAGTSLYSGEDDFAVARYNPDGSPDASFGNNGTAATPVGTGSGRINSIHIQADGRILAAGAAQDASGYNHFALARFNANGTLDSSFGSGGSVITSFHTPSIDGAYGAGIQSDGKIVAGGFTEYVSGTSPALDFAVARYSTNGALDLSYGSFGRTSANVGGDTLDIGYAMALQPDGKILVAGGAGLGNIPGPFNNNQSVNSFLALARLNANGTLDSSFGSGGTVVTQVGAYSDFATAIALQPDGKIVVAGASQNGLYKFFALRYTTNGTVDASYGTGGSTRLDFGSATNEIAYGLALDSSGRAVLAGDAGGWFGLARLEGNFVPAPRLKIFLTATNTAVISWPDPSDGWTLQQNSNLSGSNWVTSPETITDNGSNKYIIVSPPAGNRFYRLFKP